MSHILPGISNDFPGSSSTTNRKSVRAPSFEFSVTSEEGIHLFVDMNSSSLDWRKRFENEVRTCNCLQKNKFQSFREELQYLGSKFEQRKNSFVSDTNSCTKLNCADDFFYYGQYSTVNENDSALLSYPEAKNEHSEILAPEKGNYCLDVSEQLEQEGENSISSCLNSVASELVDVNSSLRGLMAGDVSETLVDDQDIMLLNRISLIDIEKDWKSGNHKPFNAASSISETEILLADNGSLQMDASRPLFTNENSLILADRRKAPLISSGNAQARYPPAAGTASLKLQKRTEKLRTCGGRKIKRHMNQNSARILRSSKSRQSYPRKCKLQQFK